MAYHCPECGNEIGFGESICPNCKADVTGVWEQASSPKNSGPKVAPGMGGIDQNESSPFPPPAGGSLNSPFPPAAGNSPFPPAANMSSPFASPKEKVEKNTSDIGSPFPGSNNMNPFAPSSEIASPFPPTPQESTPFPPTAPASSPFQQIQGPFLEIARIGGKIDIPEGELRLGRDEIQGVATIALPDLNAYKNISRKRTNSEHFILRKKGNVVTIEDRGSTNGTYMGTEKITGTNPRTLKNGDKIVLPIEEHGKMVQLEMIFKIK
ncbi:FHA domain-containing protein [Candidatus Lokiarchaeum ossiferum]|uniref:FHA domain-containing protein n=1 Tax=Candidatus Lokiarchaeum ossiferum TaxID=2951803 RepID=UPI00352D3D78